MITKEDRAAREAAASPTEATAAGLRRIAAALEALVELGVAIKLMAEREARTHLAEPPAQ
jgi:predicted phage gp36 major capsid-like protein